MQPETQFGADEVVIARGDALDVLDRLVENESVNLVSAASIQHRHELRRVSGQMAWQIVLWIAMAQQENCTKKTAYVLKALNKPGKFCELNATTV